MVIPLLGQTESVFDATLNNSGDSRGLSHPIGCQTCGRRPPTRNQQRLASARGYHFSRSDRSLHQGRDRTGRPCAHDKGARSKSHPQAHLAEVGQLPLREVKPYPVQDWLRKLPLAPKTRGHLRGLMYRLFEKAMLWELTPLERNPMGLVELKGVSKRLKPPRILTEEEFVALLNQLDHPYRCMVLLGGVYGPSYQRGDGPALEPDRLRKLGHGSPGRIRSQPSHEAEIGMFPGRIAAGSGRRNHSVGMEASLPRDARRLGLSQAPGQTNPTILARSGRRCSRLLRCVPRFRDPSAGTRCVTATAPGSTRLVLLSAYNRNSCVTRNISTTMNVYGGAFMEAKRKANTSVVQRVLPQDHTK